MSAAPQTRTDPEPSDETELPDGAAPPGGDAAEAQGRPASDR
ncbi:hypothetical protein ABT372_32365 [Streptomyces lydicus]